MFENTCYRLWRALGHRLLTAGVIDECGLKRPRRPICIPAREGAPQFERLVCVTGFGYSGSGAVLDLLSEYAGVTVNAFVDAGAGGSLRQARCAACELDLLRREGGLFALEKAIGNPSIYFQDAAVHEFLSFADHLYNCQGGLYNDQFLAAARAFLDDLIAYRLPTSGDGGYSPALIPLRRKGIALFWGAEAAKSNYLFHMREMSVAEYRAKARAFLSRVLAALPSEKCLVLDQIVTDRTADIAKYQDYLGPMKLVACRRDPRDVYATGAKLGVAAIPRDPEAFALWYRSAVASYLRLSHDDFLLLRFEDLVCDYEVQVARVERFLDLSPASHVRPRSAFDPAVSRANVGLWREMGDNPVMACVANLLTEFCHG